MLKTFALVFVSTLCGALLYHVYTLHAPGEAANREIAQRIASIESRLQSLEMDLDRISAPGPYAADPRNAPQPVAAASEAEADYQVQEQGSTDDVMPPLGGIPSDRKLTMLLNGGFLEATAQDILASELEVQKILANARQQRIDPRAELTIEVDRLKSMLGEAGYERYLEATGRESSVEILEVNANGAAARVGIQPGDRIISLNGERIYSLMELRNVVLDGIDGQLVTLIIERDGAPVETMIELGRFGVTGGQGGGYSF